MQTNFVKIGVDLFFDGPASPVTYRVFINGEMLAEKNWRSDSATHYAEEILQLQLSHGIYHVRYELVGKPNASIRPTNFRIEQGKARIDRRGTIEIS
jgi:hypothetical protein